MAACSGTTPTPTVPAGPGVTNEATVTSSEAMSTTTAAATTAAAENINLQGSGNRAGNILNGGLVAFSDGWVYYNSAPFSDKNESALYKAKSDGSEKIKLSEDSPYSLNVLGEWIFFLTHQMGTHFTE